MAKKKKKVQGGDIDWYLISIDRLKQIGLVVLLLLVGGAGYWFYTKQQGNPRTNAESAIADARQALNALASAPEFPQHRPEFNRAQQKLDEANRLLAKTQYAEAQGAAVESQTISRAALSGGGDREFDAQFLTVEGDVQFQKSATSDWKKADPRTLLFNGDWVKTGDRASAELIFRSNGSLYTIRSNALLEIFATVNPTTRQKTNAVQMQIGSVEVATSDDSSTVRTPGSQIIVESESTTQVGVDSSKGTSIVSTKGTASVVSSAGGQPVLLTSGDKINATATGTLSDVKKLRQPPALRTPADNQVFQMTSDLRVEFTWEPVEGTASYQLQVSRSRLFTTLEINSRRERATANARVTSEGAFYWRVASIGQDGEVGPFSPFRRFRVTGSRGGGATPSADTTPPALRLNRPYSIGGPFFMVEGTTEPGATVFINEEEVDVESSGHFKKLVSFDRTGRNAVVVKAIDPSGNQTVQSESVMVEE